jgi:hypothetical protein
LKKEQNPVNEPSLPLKSALSDDNKAIPIKTNNQIESNIPSKQTRRLSSSRASIIKEDNQKSEVPNK